MLRGLLAAVLVVYGVSVQADVFSLPPGQTSLQFVPVGDAGNAGEQSRLAFPYYDSTYYGAVASNYQMGKYDVTVAQYTAFLNAVAATDPNGLYNSSMATDTSYGCGISRYGLSGSYSYAPTRDGNYPVNYVSWGDAARFCNWLHNGQPTGTQGLTTTESGAYTLSGTESYAMNRNPGATYFIPTENEWYKAAYYKGGSTNAGYWAYPTKSNTAPINLLSMSGTNNANFYDYYNTGNHTYTDAPNYLTTVGYFAGSPSPYGTFDQGGDVFQWNETAFGSARGLRGGVFADSNNSDNLASSYQGRAGPLNEAFGIGFRVASVPDLGSLALSASSGTLRAMLNSDTTTAVTLSETSGTGAARFSSSLGNVATIGPATGFLTASGALSLTLGWHDYTTTGPRTDTVMLLNTGNLADPFNSSGNVVIVTGAVVDNRTVTASMVNFGVFHVGTTTAIGTSTLSTTGVDNYFTRVTVAATGGTGNFLVTGGTGTLFNAADSSGSRTLSGTFTTASSYSGNVTLATSGEGLPNETPNNVSVPYFAQVFSGQSRWAGSSSSWADAANWQDQVTPSIAAAPGIWGVVGDSATLGAGTAGTITLDGANTNLASLIFNNSSAGYTLSGLGANTNKLTLNYSTTAATIAVESGTHLIEVPVELASNLVVGGSGTLTFGSSSSITETVGTHHSLTMSGNGTLILSGTNNYTGGTNVLAGKLAVTSSTALPDGYGLTVGAGGTLIFDPSFHASTIQGLSYTDSPMIQSVPEPSTFALLGIGVIGLLSHGWRRRKQTTYPGENGSFLPAESIFTYPPG